MITIPNIISINVFEKPEFLKAQLENIKSFVKKDYMVILNCNDYMYNAIKKECLENVIVNPEIINKKRFHGSLTQGIYSNMKYCVENGIEFYYFITISSRVLFYNELNNLDIIYNNNKDEDDCRIKNKNDIDYNTWHWPSFKKTLLFSHFNKNYNKIARSLHEGLVFNFNVCKNIIHYLEGFPEIKKNLFSFNACVEEFALQTISVNYTGDNKDTGFCVILHPAFSVNNYTAEQAANFPKHKYVYRTYR
jgi:hypothetical protein